MVADLRVILTMLVLCMPQAVAALPDPTRPAIALDGAGGGAGMELETAPRGLQSIIISPQYRAAIINGKTVRLGGKTGDSRLVEVRESSVVLQNAHGRRVLELFPKVGIRMNEVAQHENSAQEITTGQPILPEKAVGGVK